MKNLRWEKVYIAGNWKIEAKRGAGYVLVHPDGFEEDFKKLTEAKSRAEEVRHLNPRFTPCRKCMHWGANAVCEWWNDKTYPDDYCSAASPMNKTAPEGEEA